MDLGIEEPAKARGRGRPRKDEINASALKAVIDLLVSGGMRAVTIDRVASEIHATREALYRRWPNAQALLQEALVDVMLKAAGRTNGAPPYSSQTMALEDAVRQMLLRLTEVFSDPRYSACYIALLSGSRLTPEFNQCLTTHNASLQAGVANALSLNPVFAGSKLEPVAKLILSAAMASTLISPALSNPGDLADMASIIAKGVGRDA